MNPIVTRAEALAAKVIDAPSGRGLIKSAEAFKVFLTGIPDAGLAAITKPGLDEISVIAEKVIEHVDARIDANKDSHETKLECATLIYGIREAWEAVHRWGQRLPA